MTLPAFITYVGVNDHLTDLFEGQYPVPNGMAYNSYFLADEKTAVLDSVDARFCHEWLANIAAAAGGRAPDYLIVQHMEPDHAGSIAAFHRAYPTATIAASAKAFPMMRAFFGEEYEESRLILKEGDTLPLGAHTLRFFAAPMVHWPEVTVTLEESEGVLFSADAFGKFGALDTEEEWDCEARRYYFGIVGKYGAQVQALLKKLAGARITLICPLHGPMLKETIPHVLSLYNTWSSYEPESDGITIAYTSVYGHTAEAVELLAERLFAGGCPKVAIHDLARCDMAEALEDAFRYRKLVLATTTYNAGVFPFMRTFLSHLIEHGYRNRTVALIENGSWAPQAAKVMREALSPLPNIMLAEPTVSLRSALSEESRAQIDALAKELTREYPEAREVPSCDPAALFSIGYGLYALTSDDGRRANAMICNTVCQVTSAPTLVAVTVSKDNYSYGVIEKTGKCNVCPLTEDAPFALFERFGFQSGRTVDKLEGLSLPRTANGLPYLTEHSSAVLSLEVERVIDLGTHGCFLCRVTESRVLSRAPTMTYTYYHSHVKPKPNAEGKRGFVCKICGYVYEGEELPPDFVCPLCKHGAADFEPLK